MIDVIRTLLGFELFLAVFDGFDGSLDYIKKDGIQWNEIKDDRIH